MAAKLKRSILDVVSLVLTLLTFVLHNVGMFAGVWYKNNNDVGTSLLGMKDFRMCEVSCVDKTVLDLEEGKEWVFAVRVFEAFGEIFILLAVIIAILMVVTRFKTFHTTIIYIHGAAAVFILTGVFIFLGFKSLSLDKELGTEGSTEFSLFLCLIGGLVCIGTSVLAAISLRKHLMAFDDEDDEAYVV